MNSRNIDIRAYDSAPSFKQLAGEMPLIKVVDVGANPIDGTPHYAAWLKQGSAKVVGFDPNEESLARLNAVKTPAETYLPYAIGDGQDHTLYITAAQGMISLLKPNPAVLNLFSGFPLWGEIQNTIPVRTTRLDDIPETAGVDFLKMDIQGAELMVLENAQDRLKTALVVEAEVEFMPMYENQPLFSDVERFMRGHGFQFHRFYEIASRMITPMKNDADPFAGMSQLLWSEAIFIRDLTKLDGLQPVDLLKSAAILHDCYHSFDVVSRLLATYDERTGRNVFPKYFSNLNAWLTGAHK